MFEEHKEIIGIRNKKGANREVLKSRKKGMGREIRGERQKKLRVRKCCFFQMKCDCT